MQWTRLTAGSSFIPDLKEAFLGGSGGDGGKTFSIYQCTDLGSVIHCLFFIKTLLDGYPIPLLEVEKMEIQTG